MDKFIYHFWIDELTIIYTQNVEKFKNMYDFIKKI